MTEDSTEDRGFTVHDRRRFDADGRPRSDEDAAGADQAGSGEPGAAEGPAGGGETPPVTFAGFIVGLATQALAQLGVEPAAGDHGARSSLAEASALIDLLAVLQAKTTGNLSEDEAKLMEEILYDLRMRYVERSKGSSQEGGA